MGSGTPAVALQPSTPFDGPTRALLDLVAPLEEAEIRGDGLVGIGDVVYRSGEARSGSLFFCVRGEHLDGHDFAAEAVRSGAVAVVAERWLDVPSAQVLVPSVRAAMGPMSAAFFDAPSRAMTMVGVTGTNGKTTATYLLESIFRGAGMNPGIVGTTGVRVAGRPVPFDRTTPEAPDLQRLLYGMRSEGVNAVAMEVSSHGLDQHRIDGTRFGCAVFTNLTQDHLDYHGTLEAYFDAKARLFSSELSDRGAVNADSPYGRKLQERASIPTITFGVEPGADLRAEEVRVTRAGLEFRIGELRIESRLRGHFNVSNCLAALAAARDLGLDDDSIRAGIAGLAGVPGRLEPVEAGQSFTVVVDYAHTPDSLDNVLRAVRDLTDRRIIVVFGCGGDRDRGKRPLMGRVATDLADLTVITSDNPRSEDPLAIIAEIQQGARSGPGPFMVESDRRTAIGLALGEARRGDVVVIAGKGHETGQELAGRTVPFDDREVAADELRALVGRPA
jgi:UDP-N-acetylmuramoyl-L-alanyl-D-glutamate--2,6-diaminopimelate ligase